MKARHFELDPTPLTPLTPRPHPEHLADLATSEHQRGADFFPELKLRTSFAIENPTQKILNLNGKVINVTRRLGEKQLQDPATESSEWEVNQKLCEEDECKESRARVTVKECVQVKDMKSLREKKKVPELKEGHWWEGDRDCRYVKLPLAMVLSDHGRCLSAESGANSISERCDPMAVNCGNVTACNRCWLLQRATENNVFTGWKLKTACGGLKPPAGMSKVMGALGLKRQTAKFLTMEEDKTLKFTDQYTTDQDRQIWNLTPAETPPLDPEKLHEEIFKKPFLLENLASKRFLVHEKPQLDEDAAKTDPLNTNMANLPDKENMPEPFKNDTEEAKALTIVRKKQWRRGFWQGVEKAGSTYLQGQMMRADAQAVPTFNFLSANPDKGFDATKHLRVEELSEDCNDRWTFVPKERGYEIKTDCESPKYLYAQSNGDGPVGFHEGPYPGPEGRWNVKFAKPPPPEPPANEETENEPVVVNMPEDVPVEVEEEAAKDPETRGAALEMVEEGDDQKAVDAMTGA
mmetsp:Transcript_62843/g.150094  ORF Transcript_62843/g.150094 Transcript_62843/m.150094 type:complete len:520 (-) Transcript_62843:24-1583(-)